MPGCPQKQCQLEGREVCKLSVIAASSDRYGSSIPESDEALRALLPPVVLKYPQSGSPRLCVLVRHERSHNHKRFPRRLD